MGVGRVEVLSSTRRLSVVAETGLPPSLLEKSRVSCQRRLLRPPVLFQLVLCVVRGMCSFRSSLWRPNLCLGVRALNSHQTDRLRQPAGFSITPLVRAQIISPNSLTLLNRAKSSHNNHLKKIKTSSLLKTRQVWLENNIEIKNWNQDTSLNCFPRPISLNGRPAG